MNEKELKSFLVEVSKLNEELACIYQSFDDIDKPYLFVLGCIMDRQIEAEKAWQIPKDVCSDFGFSSFDRLKKIHFK